MEFDITQIVSALIGLCATVITCVVVPLVKSKTTEQKQDDFLKWVKIAVSAAEQIYDATQGNAKKNYVLHYLKSKGFNLDEDDVDIAIEGFVNELHNALNKSEG